jgi:hypothetical protein
MMGVHSRLIQGLAAAVALLALTAPAGAQDTTPERSKGVDKVYRDYRDDGVIDACDHTRRALKKTLDQLAPEADVDTPDLRPALEAGIEQHTSGDCEREAEATPSPTPSPTATVTPAPTTPPTPTTDPELGSVTPPRNGGGKKPPGAADVTPLDPEVTPVPPAATPAPVTPPAAEPSGPALSPEPLYRNADDRLPLPILLLAGLLALLALVALLYALVSRLGWGESRLARTRRAWREARFRAGGTWGDFADWIRVGR